MLCWITTQYPVRFHAELTISFCYFLLGWKSISFLLFLCCWLFLGFHWVMFSSPLFFKKNLISFLLIHVMCFTQLSACWSSSNFCLLRQSFFLCSLFSFSLPVFFSHFDTFSSSFLTLSSKNFALPSRFHFPYFLNLPSANLLLFLRPLTCCFSSCLL